MTAAPAPSPNAMHALDKRLLPVALFAFAAVILLAFYTIHVTVTRLKNDGRLSSDEARHWARSKKLVGLTLAEAAPHVEVALTPAPDASGDALALISGEAGGCLRLVVRDGRVTETIYERP